jgi:hypothetical protein
VTGDEATADLRGTGFACQVTDLADGRAVADECPHPVSSSPSSPATTLPRGNQALSQHCNQRVVHQPHARWHGGALDAVDVDRPGFGVVPLQHAHELAR